MKKYINFPRLICMNEQGNEEKKIIFQPSQFLCSYFLPAYTAYALFDGAAILVVKFGHKIITKR